MSGTLPETQSALCEAMCDSLLHRREREQDEFKLEPFPAAYRELTMDQKRTLIQDLAVYMVEEGRSALTQTQARDRLARRLAGFKNRSAEEADIVLKGLLERSGILREPLPEARLLAECELRVLYKGHWILPNDPIARKFIDWQAKE